MPYRSSACRYPIAVLEHLIGSESTEDTAERLGLSHRSVTRFRSTGLTHRQADEFGVPGRSRCRARLGRLAPRRATGKPPRRAPHGQSSRRMTPTDRSRSADYGLHRALRRQAIAVLFIAVIAELVGLLTWTLPLVGSSALVGGAMAVLLGTVLSVRIDGGSANTDLPHSDGSPSDG